MIIGAPKEILNNENQVGITPAGVTAFKSNGHEVFVETNTGLGSGLIDQEYILMQVQPLFQQKEKHSLQIWYLSNRIFTRGIWLFS
ncbi:hypothetical protein [Peribacillus butanolivorans]|uniref:hypothetical protein n=1 Tax=Peribacillus butanolivorans TaxID=421767 RepID=UPI0015967F59